MNPAKTALQLTGAVLALLLLYLLAWPVPVEPLAWQAPADRGFVDPFAPNAQLKFVETWSLGEHRGPEDVTGGPGGHLFSSSEEGAVLRLGTNGDVEVFAHTGGRPLGIEADRDGSLVVANAYLGLQRIAPDGAVSVLLDTVNGRPLAYADDLAIARDGRIFFSEATTRFAAAANGGTYAASLLDIMEHGGHGLVIEFNPATGRTRTVVDGLNFANGVAISDDQSFLLIAETGAYRILKHWLAGPDAGRTVVLIDNLPGFPDNINNGMDGRFWIGLIAPRLPLLDRFSTRPFVRKAMQRLPARLRPKAIPHSQVFAIDGNGVVLMNLHDASARYPALTGVYETRDTLYLTTLFGPRLPYLRKQNL